jgi:vitamin B12 transporter
MRLKLIAAAAVLPCVVHAQANPDSPENIVVTATRVPSAVANLPAGVTVIDRKTIEERGYVSLVDALSAVPGLRVVQSGGPGAQTSVFIRGSNSNHVLVLRDGVPINDPSDPGGAFNFGVDTLQDVERIEIVRGALSSLYGSGAIGGVINLITRRGRGAPHGHITLAGGAPTQGLAQGDVAGGFGIYDYAASLEAFSTRGFDQTPQRETAIHTGEVDGDRSKQAQVELGVTPFPDTRFSVLVRARDAKYGFDEEDFDAGNATGYDASLFGRLGVTTRLLDRAWDSSLYLTGVQNDRESIITFRPQDIFNEEQADDRYHGRRADVQWNNTIHLADAGFLTANAVTFGYEHEADKLDSKNNDFFFGSPGDIGAVKAHADSDAGYAGLQSTVSSRLVLTGQVREDATSIAGDAFTYRVGGVLDVPELASHIKASYGTSFRAPALNDRYGMDYFGFGSFYFGNPNLKPERGDTYEAGVTTDLPPGIPGHASISATYFHSRINDLIVLEPIPGSFDYRNENIQRARTQGVETTLTWRFANWIQGDLTYTYTDARDLESGALLLRRPYNQGSANLRISPVPALVVAPELVYVGSFRDALINDDGSFPLSPGLTKQGTLFNLNVTYQATPQMQVFVWGKNLTGSRFEPANGYQTPGASFLAGARYGF